MTFLESSIKENKNKVMKKEILLSFMLLHLCSMKLFAQTPDSASRPVKTGNEWRMQGDAVKRSQNSANMLKREIGLNDEKTKKVFQAYLANTKPLDEIQVLPLSDKEKADKLKANKASFNEILKGILSPEEFAKYLKIPELKKN